MIVCIFLADARVCSISYNACFCSTVTNACVFVGRNNKELTYFITCGLLLGFVHYENPMTNCSSKFQERVVEIKALEDKTKRWERKMQMKKQHQQQQRLLQQSSSSTDQ